MKVRATVEIKGCDLDTWKNFYKSYEADRSKYIKNETVLEVSDGWAEVVFEITDMDGLTELSKRQDIIDFEALNGITVTINAAQIHYCKKKILGVQLTIFIFGPILAGFTCDNFEEAYFKVLDKERI